MRFLLFLAMAAALSLSLLAPAPASAAGTHDTTSVQAADGRPLESASWHGRPIRQPHQHTAEPTAAEHTASGIRRGTGYRTPGGSQRVRTIQRRLQQLGYRPGPADGRFGPRTEAALRWFEHKHGLESTDSATAATLAHLRDRVTGAADPSDAVAPRPERSLHVPQPADPQTTHAAETQQQPPHVDDAVVSGILVALVLLGAAVFVTAFVQARSRARHHGPAPATAAGRAPPRPIRSGEEIRP